MLPSDPVGHSSLSGLDIVTFWESPWLIKPLNLAALFPLSMRMQNASVHFPGLNSARGLRRKTAWNDNKKEETGKKSGNTVALWREKETFRLWTYVCSYETNLSIRTLLNLCCFAPLRIQGKLFTYSMRADFPEC